MKLTYASSYSTKGEGKKKTTVTREVDVLAHVKNILDRAKPRASREEWKKFLKTLRDLVKEEIKEYNTKKK